MEERFVLGDDEWTAKLDPLGGDSFELKITRNGELATIVGWTEDAAGTRTALYVNNAPWSSARWTDSYGDDIRLKWALHRSDRILATIEYEGRAIARLRASQERDRSWALEVERLGGHPRHL